MDNVKCFLKMVIFSVVVRVDKLVFNIRLVFYLILENNEVCGLNDVE